MSNESRLVHSGQILLEEAGKSFNEGNQSRGISFIDDCVTLLGNGLKNLKKATEQPTEPTEQPPQVEQPTEAAAEPESKEGSGVVKEPAQSEGKGDAGVVSEPEKSQNRDGSGIVNIP